MAMSFLLGSAVPAAALLMAVRSRRRRRHARADGGQGLVPVIERRLAQRGAAQTYFAVVRFDRFGGFRDTVGLDIASATLADCAERIRAAIDDAQIGRVGYGSVEFIFGAADDAAAAQALGRCLDRLDRTIRVDGIECRLSGTIAFTALAAQPGSIPDTLGDGLASTLGRPGPGRVRRVDAAAHAPPSVEDLDILRALPQALAEGELSLHYQPKFNCRDQTVTGAEALLRWHSPVFGALPTDRIIALAERTGAVRDLTVWVVQQVARDQRAMIAAGHPLAISVNLSGMLIADDAFMMELLDHIAAASGPIGVEITETALISDPEAAIRNLNACSAAGVSVAIDDFGSGLSSLTYLKRLPADELKIDRVFVSGLTHSHRDPLIVRASIDLAHALEMTVTAEGVDDPMALSLLRVMGCDMLQGYFISRPVPVPELIRFMDSERRHLRPADHAAAAGLGQDGGYEAREPVTAS